jgi:hypothetical protein
MPVVVGVVHTVLGQQTVVQVRVAGELVATTTELQIPVVVEVAAPISQVWVMEGLVVQVLSSFTQQLA